MIDSLFLCNCIDNVKTAIDTAKRTHKKYVYIVKKQVREQAKIIFQVQDYFPTTSHMDVVMIDATDSKIAEQVTKLLT